MYFHLLVAALAVSTTQAWTPSNAKTSMTLMYQNNLNITDDVNHVGFLVLDPMTQKDGAAACASVSEKLVPSSMINAHKDDFLKSLSYNAFAGRALAVQPYYIDGGVVVVTQSLGELVLQPLPVGNYPLPILCTQSDMHSQPVNATATAKNQIFVESSSNTYMGYRNQKSFRFLGIPFADKPKRWAPSVEYSATGQMINATSYLTKCAQGGTGGEDCLWLNIQTPYLPKQGSTATKNLRPVLFWIHGGGYVTGDASDAGTDGGNLASRSDIVTVTINYRLGTLGFLAIPGTSIVGNFGIGDQVVALDWTLKNIASFGGDPNHIYIAGDSAGAASVRVQLGNPKTIGKYQGALALSDLGGGVDLGLTGNYATAYSSYINISTAYAGVGQNLFHDVGCNSTDLNEQIACLETIPAVNLTTVPDIAQKVIQDNNFVPSEELDLITPNGTTAYVPVMFGNTYDEGASIGASYPKFPVTSYRDGISASLSISNASAQAILDSGLFPVYNTGNITLDAFNVSARVGTDNNFRCTDEATVYAGAASGVFPVTYYFTFTRTIGGYDPSGLGGPPVTPGFPDGNPNLPYFRYHSSDVPWVTGNLETIREPPDLWSVQLQTDSFASFFKTGNPNPSRAYLATRGYAKTIEGLQLGGQWQNIKNAQGPIRLLDWPSTTADFIDLEQCKWLNYTISYYLDGGI